MDGGSVSAVAHLALVNLQEQRRGALIPMKDPLSQIARRPPLSKRDKEEYVPTAILCCVLLVSNQEHAQAAHYLPNFRLILNLFTEIRCMMLTPRVSW